MTPLVLYHANCTDGFCAAWVAKQAMPDAECVPVQYGQDPPNCAGRDVYIVDFSFKRPVMRQILSSAHKVVVLDHHKTAESELAGIVDEFVQRPDLIQNPPGSELPVVHFDMNKSGGRLAWEYVWQTLYGAQYEFLAGPSGARLSLDAAPWLVDYTEDRDLWRFKLDKSKEISAFLRSHPFDFKLWDTWDDFKPGSDQWNTFAAEGAAILRYQDEIIRNATENASEIDMDGHKVLAVNTTVCFSEIAGELAKDRPFGAAFFIRKDGKKQWSLRSRDGGIDVAELAKRHGGGGHKQAAGFEE